MQIKYTNGMSFLTVSEENKIGYRTEEKCHNTHNWNPGIPHEN